MVKENKKSNGIVYNCEACGFSYASKEWAEKCERWCRAHNSCNLEIIKHAVKKNWP